jgi:IclR family transcriptional regulator, KDG regulon repressor
MADIAGAVCQISERLATRLAVGGGLITEGLIVGTDMCVPLPGGRVAPGVPALFAVGWPVVTVTPRRPRCGRGALLLREEGQTIRSVERALDVLLCFAGEPGGLGVTQIAEKVNLYKSTVHRILAALESRGFVRQDGVTGRYLLGLKALELASAYLTSGDVPAVAYPEMLVLRDRTQETVSLYVRDGCERVRVQRAEGPLTVRRVVGLGERLPLYLGASGKVLLAWLPPADREGAMGRCLPPDFDRVGLEADLADARERGWATSQQEREEGAASVAAPVLDRMGRCVAALAISGPLSRFDAVTVAGLTGALLQSSRAIGLRL